jgi:protein O-GlcNAc transferase
MARIPTTSNQRRPAGGNNANAGRSFAQGLASHREGQLDKAAGFYERVLQVSPSHFPALHMLGVIHAQTKRYESAVRFFDKAISINPTVAEAYANRGIALQKLGKFGEAISNYDKAIALKPAVAEAHSNRGIALKELKRFDEALASYQKAIAIRPAVAEVHLNCAIALEGLRRFEEAAVSYERAFALKPDLELLLGNLLHVKMRICDWAGLDQKLGQYERAIQSSKMVTEPFPALSLVDLPVLHKKAAQLYAETKYPKKYPPGGYGPHPRHDRIRIGYFSADLHNHAVGHLVAELFECHDSEKFEIVAFFFGPNTQDELQKRIFAAFDQFHDVGNKNDQEIAALARALEIDIAIDLMGHTKDSRMGIFAERCAPIQANYVGYPGTTGAEYIDYILADGIVIPKERQSDFTEKVVFLPNSSRVNDSKRRISERPFSRQELGLPETGFVFCCFNITSKILPATFDVWMRLLLAVEGSVLWLLEDNPAAAVNLRKEAGRRGVDGGRLVFAGRMPIDEHLARHRAADLFLDTLPYNAHTTVTDALWSGLPVLTLIGKTFAGRVAASALRAIGLPELITQTEAEYEALALELATNPEKLATINHKLQENRLTTPLFDTKGNTRNLEAAYAAMYERHCAGLVPQSIELAQSSGNPSQL